MDTFSGVLRFYSLQEVRKYLKELLEVYEKEYDESSNKMGLLLREEGDKGMEVIMSKGWTKAGSMFVNIEDPEKSKMEVFFQFVTEMKPKVTETEEVLKSFDRGEALPIPEEATFLLYLRRGIPERLIVDTSTPRPEKFSFSGQFITVSDPAAAGN